MKTLNLLVWITQFGLSILSPILLYLGLGFWLRSRFGLGLWILVILGAVGIVSSIRSAQTCIRIMCKAADAAGDQKEPPVAFNNHK